MVVRSARDARSATLPRITIGTVTIAFTDLVGSSRLLGRVGEDAFHALRAEHDALLREAAAEHCGTIVKHGGDGVMAAFAAASDAVGFAVSVQRAIARRNRRSDEPLAVRIGCSAGDVRIENGDYFGTPVVEAARLCSVADGHEILVTEIVRLLTGSHGGHQFDPVEPLTLPGIDRPVPAAMVAWTDVTGVVPLPRQLAVVEPLPFVGRTAAREQLDDEWRAVRGGAARAVLVAGEPGIGKTRLAAELARAAHGEGALVLFGRCDEDGGAPYQPLVEALRHDLGNQPDASARLGSSGVHLVPLLPELESTFGGEPPRGDVESARLQMFEALVAWLGRAASERPVVFVMDDLQWAAKPTLLALRHLVRAAVPEVLVLATYRTTDLDREHPLSDVLVDLRKEPGVARVALSGLGRDDIVDLLARSGRQTLGEQGRVLADAIARETAGNPFFVGEVLRHLVESGSIYRGEDGWTSDVDIAQLAIPEGVREVVGRRLTALGGNANTVLRAAAVAGAEFDVRVLDRMPSVGDPLDALEAATSAGLLRETTPGAYEFAHSIVRRTLLDECSGARLMRLHAEVADAIGSAQDISAILARAHHLLAAVPVVPVGSAVDAAVLAAQASTRQYAHEGAVAILRRAIEVLDLDPDPVRRVDVLGTLASCHGSLYETQHGRAAALEAMREAERIGDRTRLGEAAMVLGLLLDPMSPEIEAISALEHALPMFDDAPAHLRATALAPLAFARTVGLLPGDPVELARDIDAALPGFEDQNLWDQTRFVSGFCRIGSPDVDLLVQAARELRRGDGVVRSDLSHFAFKTTTAQVAQGGGFPLYLECYAALRRGEVDEFDARRRELAEFGETTGLRLWAAQAMQWSAARAILHGDLDDALAMAGRAPQLLPEALGFVFGAANQRAFVHAMRGSREAALAELDVLGLAPDRDWSDVVRAWSLAVLDDPAGSLDVLGPLDSLGACAMPAHWGRPGVLWMLADLALRRDDRTLATRVFDELAPFDGQLVMTMCTHVVGSAAAALAGLDAMLGRRADAIARFDAAIAFERAAGATPLLARTLVAAADVLDGSDSSTAARMHSEADAIATRLGLAPAFLGVHR